MAEHPTSYDACMENVKELLRHGARVAGGVDAFDIPPACSTLGIRDLDSVGLILWSGAHPRRHDGKDTTLQVELRQHFVERGVPFTLLGCGLIFTRLEQVLLMAMK